MGDNGSNFERTVEIITDGGIRLTKYVSKISGLKVCIGEADGPLVGGYLCIATEAHDDDGLPHTLEHLVFLGSEKYPYKGILDLVANRCLASGTNAWTDTDHTCYTMTTAGDEGFLKLLPIYVDHLLYPTLTESAFVTEVHHINGDGEDAGVVYCEMQARENSGESRCHLSMLRSMYPGHCGYKSQTGGLLQNLRESTTNIKVHDYHKEFYRPENLCIIIVGQIEAAKVFESLKPIEDRILSEGERKPFVRPWISSVPPLPDSMVFNVDYPCDEDEYGLVIAAWRGPTSNDYSQLLSIQILMDYFTDTSVSPLKREFVESEDPLCNDVDYTVIENSVSCIYLHFSNVPIKKLNDIKEKLFTVLKNVADGTEALDMKRMKTVIKKKKLYILSNMEDNPHDELAMCLIGDFLYGTTYEDLEHRVKRIPTIDHLFEKGPEFWINLLKTYMIEGKYVIVLGTPSPKLSDEMAAKEKQRINEQKEKLGPNGLKDRSQMLKNAVKTNEVPPPVNMIKCVSVPSVKSIKFHPIQRLSNSVPDNKSELDKSLSSIPLNFHLDVVHSNFIRMYVILDTSELSQDLRMYLPLFVELLDECAIKRNGEIIPYQEVVKQLAEDTISFDTSLGLDYSRFFCGKFSQLLCLELMVEEEKYIKSIDWIREILYQIIFEPCRIKSSINKMITEVATLKRSGSKITKTIMRNLCFVPQSNHWTASMLRQAAFLSNLLQKLESQPDEIVKCLNEVRELVTLPEKITVHVALDEHILKNGQKLEEIWKRGFLPPSLEPKRIETALKYCHQLVRSDNDLPRNIITGVGSVESSFLMLTAPCITSYKHPDFAPLLVLIQYLTQLEGPMWRQIRGIGLAYSCNMFLDPLEGLIYFVLFQSTHLVRAFEEGRNIIESHINGTLNWDMALFESGCSSLVFEIIERVKTIADVVEESVAAYYKNIDMSYTKELLEKIYQVSFNDMERVGKLYLKPLFDPAQSRCAICCHSNKVKEIADGFNKLSRELTIVPSLEESFIAKI